MLEAEVNPSQHDARTDPSKERLSGAGKFIETKNPDGTLAFVLHSFTNPEHPTEILFRQETKEKSVVTYRNTIPSNAGVLTFTDEGNKGTIEFMGEDPLGNPDHAVYEFSLETVINKEGKLVDRQTFHQVLQPGQQIPLLLLDSTKNTLFLISNTINHLRADKPYYAHGGLQKIASPPHRLGLTPNLTPDLDMATEQPTSELQLPLNL